MPLPQKAWFRLAEVAERWNLLPADIEDYALDEQLQLAVLVVGVPAEQGSLVPSEAGPHRLPEGTIMLDGPQPLLRDNLLEIIRSGEAEVYRFGPVKGGGYLRLRREVPPRVVRRDDLIMTRAERDRLEREHGLGPQLELQLPPATTPILQQESDFRVLHFRGQTWQLGAMQAAVVRQLHEAWQTGQHWVSGKAVLAKAGASSMRMRDLFKTHPGWQTLLLSDGRGQYRINLPVERVRLFRRFGSSSPARNMANSAMNTAIPT